MGSTKSLPEPSAEDLRLAERWVALKFGEDLAPQARAAVDTGPESPLPEALERTHAELHSACQGVRAPSSLAGQVMAALPPTLTPASSAEAQLFVARSRFRIWQVAATAAAVLCLALTGWHFWLQVETPPEIARAAQPVLKGVLVTRDGRRATQIVPGEQYRVDGGESVVVRSDSNGLLRLEPQSEFEVSSQDASSLHLENGVLYAHQDGSQSVQVSCLCFETEVSGTSMLQQEARPGAADQDGYGQALVWVIQGQAQVHTPLRPHPLTLSEGEVYISGLEAESVVRFLDQAEARSAQLAGVSQSGADLAEQRRIYDQEVRGYERQLAQVDRELGQAGAATANHELRDRRARILNYLAAHRDRLDLLRAAEEESPQRRAHRIRRAAESLKQGKLSFVDPSTWL